MLPNITPEIVQALVPDVSNVSLVGKGGQKQVFRGDIHGVTYALKFALLPDVDPNEDDISEVESRIKREIAIMKKCKSDHMVRLGPVGLTVVDASGQRVIYFSEEFVDGQDLKQILVNEGWMSVDEVCRLGREIADAVSALWSLGMVHRDIKPQNIMRLAGSGLFVLLDAGYAFDIVGDSLSEGRLFGTMPYFPPERFDYAGRRTSMDFRSDMFSLGVTMYQMATGEHPFLRRGEGSQHVLARICTYSPPPPSAINDAIPGELDRVILRMLGKAPHLRYRTIDRLIKALSGIGGVG